MCVFCVCVYEYVLVFVHVRAKRRGSQRMETDLIFLRDIQCVYIYMGVFFISSF